MPATHLSQLSPEETASLSPVLERYGRAASEFKISRNTVGYVNKTFVLEGRNEKLVLRESNPATTAEHLSLEVEVLRYLDDQGYGLAPRLLPNSEGAYLTVVAGKLYLLQNFMPGEMKVSWNNLDGFTLPMLESFFRASAGFTRAVEAFRSSRDYPNQSLFHYIEQAARIFDSSLARVPAGPVRELLLAKREVLLVFVAAVKQELVGLHYDQLPKQLTHFDLHPGNVHFSGDQVVAIFDFDWVRFDTRISDLAATIGQSCYIYGGEQSGLYIKDRVWAGLDAYRAAHGQSEFSIAEENRLVQSAMKGYMFFQFLWAVDWFANNPNAPDGLTVVRHMVNTCLINDYEKLFSR